MTKRIAILAGSISLVILAAAIITVVCLAANSSPSFPKGYDVGVWEWRAPDQETKSQQQADALALRQEGVTNVYIDISSYNDHDEIADHALRARQTAAFVQSLRQEVSILRSYGIRASALAGNERWANPDYWYVPLKLLHFVDTYNQSAPADARLAGLQFDIEFYSAADFVDNPAASVANYQSLVGQLIGQYQTSYKATAGPSLGFIIPSWFDGSNAAIPKTPKPLAFWLADQLRPLHGSALAVMAYRTQTGGSDGTIAKMQPVLDYIQQAKSPVRVFIGQETTNVQPAKITFYASNKKAVKQAVTQLQSTFSANKNLAGFIFNDEDGFLRLKDQ